MPFITTADGVEIFYKDWGHGPPPSSSSHGWPLNADSWEAQQLLLADNGFRAIAHDRRGHGRSTPGLGRQRDGPLRRRPRRADRGARPRATSSSSASRPAAARSPATSAATAPARVAKVALVSAVPPFMLQTDDNPGGVPIEVFDGLRAGSLADRSQLYRDLADGPFFGNNRAGRDVSQGTRDAFWRQGMQAGHRNAYESIAAFSATDFRDDLAKFDVPTLVIHGDDDQVVPIEVGGKASAALIAGAELKVYEGAPHGITDTHKDQLNADLLAFARAPARRAAGAAA